MAYLVPVIPNYERMHSAEECISTYDPQLNITGWNASCEKRYGIKAADVLGKPLLEVFPFAENDYRLNCLKMAATTGNSFFFPDMPYLYIQPFSLYTQYIYPLYTDGELSGVINIVRNHKDIAMYTVADFMHLFIEEK